MIAKRSSYFASVLLTSAALGCGPWLVGAAATQPYPNRLIKLVVPFPVGGPLDITARAIADKMSGSIKQPFMIENRPGAGGNIETEAVARAAPDGYTLGMVLGTTLTVNPSLFKKLPAAPLAYLNMKHGVRIPADKRPAMALRAWEIKVAGGDRRDVAAELDVSEPTARNLILAGRRIAEGRG